MQIGELTQLNYAPPKPCKTGKALIFSFAEEISRKTRAHVPSSEQFELNPYNVFKKVLRGNILYAHLHDWCSSSALYVHGRNSMDLVLPYWSSPAEDIRNMPLYIGLYFLHSLAGENRIGVPRGALPNTVFYEAWWWFSSSFMMPKYLLDKFKIRDRRAIQEFFGFNVHPALIDFRLNNMEY